MKKFLVYAFSVFCAVSMFSACGDDNEPADETWKEISKTYSTTTDLALTINESAVVLGEGRSVTVNATSAEVATVTLTNVVPDGTSVEINTVMTKATADCNLSGETTINGAKIAIKGVYENKILKLDITRTLTTSLTGTWNLVLNTIEEQPVKMAGVYADVVTGSPQADAMIPQLSSTVGMLIGSKVSGVKALLKENGTFDVKWTKLGETAETGMPAMIASIVQIHYVVGEKALMIALDKQLLTNPMLSGVISAMLEQYNFTLQQLTALMTDLGGYYGFPIYYKLDGNKASFYLDKATIVPVLTMIDPIIKDKIPAEMAPMFTGLMQVLPTASKVEFGLNFTK